CRELLLTPDVREKARQLGQEHPELAEICEKLAEGIPVEGMESLAPALLGGADKLELLLHCTPARTVAVQCDPERIRTRAHDLVRTSEEFLEASWAAAAVGGQAPVDLGAAAFRTLADVRGVADELGQPWWAVSPFGIAAETKEAEPWEDPVAAAADLAEDRTLTLGAQPAPLY